MLEAASLTELEVALRARGFFEGGADGLVADVFLGYGLSNGLRRNSTAPPPEPCALPRAAVGVRPARQVTDCYKGFRVGEWERSWDDEAYANAIEAVRAAIGRGDVYQVNLVQHLSAPFGGDPAGLAERVAPLRPLQ